MAILKIIKWRITSRIFGLLMKYEYIINTSMITHIAQYKYNILKFTY